MAILLGCDSVSLEFPTKAVLDGVTLGVNEGDRIGIVGRNGDGKSTLLGVLTGMVEPDEGRVTHRRDLRVGVLGQADGLKDSDSVERAVVGDQPAYEWAADPRVRAIIHALIADVPWDAPVGSLSGGQRRRVDLARLLIGTWDVLMLDEPTNHLDVRAISWLARHLQERWQPGQGALLVVTHDRWFLDAVCDHMWEVHDGQVDPFEGGYSAYILQRVERERAAAVREQRRQNMIRKELAWLSRGAQARTSKAKFRIDAARELIADEPPVRNTLELKRLATARLGKQVIDLEGVWAGYGGDGAPAEPVLRGSDIAPFTCSAPKRWLHFAPQRFQQTAPEAVYRAPEKIVYNFIGQHVRFALDREKRLTLNSCNILLPKLDGIDTAYLLAVLNSSFTAFYLQKRFASLKLLRTHLESLPIAKADEAAQKKLAAWAEPFINGQKAFTPSDRRTLDEMVFALYGFTQQEQMVILSENKPE